jgi:hypothetical protein
VIRFATGHLSRVNEDRPPPAMDGGPVEVEWHVKQIAAETRSDGKVDITWTKRLTATKLPENTRIGTESFGERAAHMTPSGEPPLIEVTRADQTSAPEEAPDARTER